MLRGGDMLRGVRYLPRVDDWNNPLSPIFSAMTTVYGRFVAVCLASIATVSSASALDHALAMMISLSLLTAVLYAVIALLLALLAGVTLFVSLGVPGSTGSMANALILLGGTAFGTLALSGLALVNGNVQHPGILLASFFVVIMATLSLRLQTRKTIEQEDKAIQLGREMRCGECGSDLAQAIKQCEQACPQCGALIHDAAVSAAHRQWKREQNQMF